MAWEFLNNIFKGTDYSTVESVIIKMVKDRKRMKKLALINNQYAKNDINRFV